MQKVLLSAFMCDPTRGSEASNGWHWATGLASEGLEVHCFTRTYNRTGIDSFPQPSNVKFHYISLPLKLEKLYSASTAGMYLYYVAWQWLVYRKAKKMSRTEHFKVAHHVTWGSLQLGSFLYKLKLPFIFGPAGGGQNAPHRFQKYFLQHWDSELKREKVSAYLEKYNPGFRPMIKKAHAVTVSNTESLQLAQTINKDNIYLSLDAALPMSFFPEVFIPKKPAAGALKLLWVGRFMPRKGLLLLLEVMKELKSTNGVTLTIVGDGEMKDAVVEKIGEYGLEDTVRLTGLVPFSEVKQYYASHDVFFFTSLRESGGVQLVEAMAFGLPVVTLDLHGQAMIVNEETGFRASCKTPEEAIKHLTKAIGYLYDHPEVVSQMSAAAHQFAKNQTWETKIKNFIENYYP